MKNNTRLFAVADVLMISNLAILFGSGFLAEKTIFTAVAVCAAVIFSLYFIKLNIKIKKSTNHNHRLNIMNDGRELLIVFGWSFVFNIVSFLLWKTFLHLPLINFIAFFVVSLILSAILVFNGVIRICSTSKQLGIILRLLIIFLWWLPVFNIIIIVKACEKVHYEYELETEKDELDNVRKENEICSTKYPILMVHGVFFRDLRFFNYWGRVPKELIRNGAAVYYGDQHSAASVVNCASELAEKIRTILSETGAEKVNIIAHSKGGLDSRYAISCLGMDKYVASLTTINTPHRGCEYADFLIAHIPTAAVKFIAAKYNSALKKLGEANPDFIAAVTDLTSKNCRELNENAPDSDKVYYQSVGSRMKNSRSAGFPLNLSYHLVKFFSKNDNDGLVDISSMKWGERHIFFEPQTKRGLSHGDMIDLFREDIKGFDIREEYVNIVKDLKNMGY